MKTSILTRSVMALMIAGVAFYSCTKSNMSNNNSGSDATSSTSLQTAADDQSQVSLESEAVSDDANTALNGDVSVSGSSISQSGSATITTMGINHVDSVGAGGGVIVRNDLICDASVTFADTNGARTITITYDGKNCAGNRTRTGTITISIPNGVYWKDAGAAVTITIKNLTITRIRDNKTIIINGTRTYTNVTGGLLVNLATTDSIVHTITGSISIAFSAGGERTWNVSKRRVFTYNNGIFLTTTGTHTDSLGNTDVAEWGVNRYGVTFESLISEPKTFAQSCDFQLTGGQNEVLRSDGWNSVITYGLNASGEATGCPTGSGTYYYKLVVSSPNGRTYTYILPY